MNQPLLSIITGTRNRPESFNRLLASIREHTRVSWELIVSDASDEPFDCEDRAVLIIPERPRLGCTKGYNVAFRHACGEWVIWLNDDAEVLPGYDFASIQFMRMHPEIGLGALYYSENGSAFHVNSYFDMVYANFGCISREFGESIGWMDEDFEMYGNDNAFAFKVLLASKGVAAIPGSRVLHHAVHDAHRIENNRDEDRWRDVERLMAKYGSKIRSMQEVYRTFAVQNMGQDQTPPSLRERLA